MAIRQEIQSVRHVQQVNNVSHGYQTRNSVSQTCPASKQCIPYGYQTRNSVSQTCPASKQIMKSITIE